VFDPAGNVYKCCIHAHDVQSRIGSVITGDRTENFYRWMSFSPFDQDKCLRCAILPWCMGGCPYFVLNPRSDTQGCDSESLCGDIRALYPGRLANMYAACRKMGSAGGANG